jgi:hypothetical protein
MDCLFRLYRNDHSGTNVEVLERMFQINFQVLTNSHQLGAGELFFVYYVALYDYYICIE